MKKALTLVLAVTLLLALLAGCAGENGTATTAVVTTTAAATTAATTTAATTAATTIAATTAATTSAVTTAPATDLEPVTLRMSWWGSQVRHDGTIAVLEMFMDKYPNVTIEYEYSGWDGYWDKIAAQASANSLPNVWQQSVAYVKMYAEAGQILDMQPYVDNGIINLSDWSEAAVDVTRIDGKLYSLSLGNAAHCAIYDPDLFNEAGVPLPTMDWTWDDYKAAMKGITEALGIFGDQTFPNMNSKDGLRHFIFSQGYTMYNEEQNALNFPQELMVEYLNWEKEMQDAGYVADEATKGEITTTEASLVVTGEAAMNSTMNSNMCVSMMEAAGKELGIVCYPHLEGETRNGTVLTPSMLINISNTGSDADKKASAMVVDFILNDIGANMKLAAERGVPANSKVAEALLASDVVSKYSKLTIEYVNTVAPTTEADPDALRPAADGEIITIYENYHDQVMFGQMSAEDAAAAFFTDANALLAAK